jgi:hypothetical protein
MPCKMGGYIASDCTTTFIAAVKPLVSPAYTELKMATSLVIQNGAEPAAQPCLHAHDWLLTSTLGHWQSFRCFALTLPPGR